LKRLIPLAILAALTAAACGSTKTASSTTTATAGSSPTTAASTASASIGNPSSPVTLSEDGSSLLYPFLQELVSPLKAQYPNISLAPAAGGSGKGITDAIAGAVQFGGSDAYLSSLERSKHPGLLDIPIVISSQAVDFNVTSVSKLDLTGNVLAQIYEGKITKWNDPAIAALNAGLSLPAENIVPVRRLDSSGDTFLFTSFLSATNPAWSNGPSYGTSVTWPAVSDEVTAEGNPAMVQTCKTTPGCVAYIGISAQSLAVKAGLGQAELQNKAGNFLEPSPSTVESAVSAGAGNVPADLAASLIYEPGAQSYPIVNFEYIVVQSKQSTAEVAQAIRTFLTFATSASGGSTPAYLTKEQFVALPASVLPKVQAAIAQIS
jgi:phosphate transport system substrate-binding protein